MSTDRSNKQQNILTNQSKLCELFKSVPCVLGRIKISMMHFLDFICVKMHDFCVNAIPANIFCILSVLKIESFPRVLSKIAATLSTSKYAEIAVGSSHNYYKKFPTLTLNIKQFSLKTLIKTL